MDPSGYARTLSREPLPNTPAHTVIFHYGLGDAQVRQLSHRSVQPSAVCHFLPPPPIPPVR